MSSFTHLDEVKDPVSRSKLIGIQEGSYALDEELKVAQRQVHEKRGAATALNQFIPRLLGAISSISKAIHNEDEDAPEVKEAKIRIAQINNLIGMVTEAAGDAQADVSKMIGQVAGIERSQGVLQKKFDENALKIDRWERELEGDESVSTVADRAAKAAIQQKNAPPAAEDDSSSGKGSGNGSASTVKKKSGKKVAKKKPKKKG